MVRRIVSFALLQPLFLLLIVVLFVAAGVAAFRSLPVEAFPDVSDIQTTVITLFPGHAPEEVEKQVTIPLEIVLAGVPHSVRMFSHTQFGLSFLTLTFDDQVDDYFARQRVLERLQQADLPGGIQPQLAPLSTPVGELYRYRLVSTTVSVTELRSIEDWVVERALRLSPGVADVVSRGGFIKQYQVSLDLARMKSYGVSLQQVFNALGAATQTPAGTISSRANSSTSFAASVCFDRPRTSARSSSPSTPALRSSSAISPTSGSARCRARASSGATTRTTW
jgi:heavy metal efflux system protein